MKKKKNNNLFVKLCGCVGKRGLPIMIKTRCKTWYTDDDVSEQTNKKIHLNRMKLHMFDNI